MTPPGFRTDSALGAPNSIHSSDPRIRAIPESAADDLLDRLVGELNAGCRLMDEEEGAAAALSFRSVSQYASRIAAQLAGDKSPERFCGGR